MCLENTFLILDFEAGGFSDVVDNVIKEFEDIHKLNAKIKAQAKKVLLFRHQHMTKHGMMNSKEFEATDMNAKMMYTSGKADGLKDFKVRHLLMTHCICF